MPAPAGNQFWKALAHMAAPRSSLIQKSCGQHVASTSNGSTRTNSMWPSHSRIRVQQHAGPAPKGMKGPATQWVTRGLIGRVKHLRGHEYLRHASLQNFREEDHADSSKGR